MYLIKKLITREWIRFFFASMISLIVLLTIGNLISGFLRGNVSPQEVLLNYLILFPSFLTRVIPISCLVASLFSINKLKNRNELTAIFASGYSRQSYILDLVKVSTIIAIVQFIISAYLNPFIKSTRHNLLDTSITKFRALKSQGLSSSTIGSGKVWYKGSNYYFSFSHFDSKENTLHDVSIYYYDSHYKVKTITHARKLTYNKTIKAWTGDKKKVFTNLNNPSFPHLELDTAPAQINEQISDFKQIEADITTLSFFRLYEYISRLKSSGINVGEYVVLFYKHISDSLICIIFTLLAATSIFNPNRRNSSFGKSASFVFVFTILYWLIQTYFIELGKNLKVAPFAACFTIPIIFLVFISAVFHKNRNLA